MKLGAVSLAQIDISGDKIIIQLQGLGKFPRDVAVARPGHSQIGFRQEKNVSFFEKRMVFQDLKNPLELNSPLDVPTYGPIKGLSRGGRGKLAHFVTREDLFDLRF